MRSARIVVARLTRGALACALATALVAAPAAARAAGEDGDDWLGPDKALHFGVSAGLGAGGYAAGAALLDARGHALLAGGAFAFGAGIAKELLDLAGSGDPSWKDLTWDALGTVTGLAVAWSADLLLRGVSPRHPLLVAPSVEREGAGAGVRVLVRF